MSYLICEDCEGYYELQNGESADDFDTCQCGGHLEYLDSINDSTPQKSKSDSYNSLNLYAGKIATRNEFLVNSNDTNEVTELGLNNDYFHYNKTTYKNFFSENFITNSGFILATFSAIPIFYGLIASSWILYAFAFMSIALSVAFFFLNNSESPQRDSNFQKLFIIAGILFGLSGMAIIFLLANPDFTGLLLSNTGYRKSIIWKIIIYLATVYFSFNFSYTFLRNSMMDERIDLLKQKEGIYKYYFIIYGFVIFLIFIIICSIFIKFG
ncbi:MAG: hypothetical protein Q8M97_03035 [Methanobacteriaceae archaeon]|nr:hypothetical protein [Methanobacteriaceae archaeon]